MKKRDYLALQALHDVKREGWGQRKSVEELKGRAAVKNREHCQSTARGTRACTKGESMAGEIRYCESKTG